MFEIPYLVISSKKRASGAGKAILTNNLNIRLEDAITWYINRPSLH